MCLRVFDLMVSLMAYVIVNSKFNLMVGFTVNIMANLIFYG